MQTNKYNDDVCDVIQSKRISLSERVAESALERFNKNANGVSDLIVRESGWPEVILLGWMADEQ